MATLASLQTGYADYYLHRGSTDIRPWTATEVQAHIQTAIDRLWRDAIGLPATGDIATDPTKDAYTLPTGMERVSRIDLLDADGLHVDRVTSFRVQRASTPTIVIVQPLLASGYTMRLQGWKRMSRTGSDLPVELEAPVAYHGVSLAFAALAGELLNSKRQQNEETGRAVSYQDAAQGRDYWRAAYQEAIDRSPYRMRSGGVAAYR